MQRSKSSSLWTKIFLVGLVHLPWTAALCDTGEEHKQVEHRLAASASKAFDCLSTLSLAQKAAHDSLERILGNTKLENLDLTKPEEFRRFAGAIRQAIDECRSLRSPSSDYDPRLLRGAAQNFLYGELLSRNAEVQRRKIAKDWKEGKTEGKLKTGLENLIKFGAKIPGDTGDIDLSNFEFTREYSPEELGGVVQTLQSLYPEASGTVPSLFYNPTYRTRYGSAEPQLSAVRLGNYVVMPVDQDEVNAWHQRLIARRQFNAKIQRNEPDKKPPLRVLPLEGFKQHITSLQRSFRDAFANVDATANFAGSAPVQALLAWRTAEKADNGNLLNLVNKPGESWDRSRRSDKLEAILPKRNADSTGRMMTLRRKLLESGMFNSQLAAINALIAAQLQGHQADYDAHNKQVQAMFQAMGMAGAVIAGGPLAWSTAGVSVTPGAMAGAVSGGAGSVALGSIVKGSYRYLQGDGSLLCTVSKALMEDGPNFENAIQMSLVGGGLAGGTGGLLANSGTKALANLAMGEAAGASAINGMRFSNTLQQQATELREEAKMWNAAGDLKAAEEKKLEADTLEEEATRIRLDLGSQMLGTIGGMAGGFLGRNLGRSRADSGLLDLSSIDKFKAVAKKTPTTKLDVKLRTLSGEARAIYEGPYHLAERELVNATRELDHLNKGPNSTTPEAIKRIGELNSAIVKARAVMKEIEPEIARNRDAMKQLNLLRLYQELCAKAREAGGDPEKDIVIATGKEANALLMGKNDIGMNPLGQAPFDEHDFVFDLREGVNDLRAVRFHDGGQNARKLGPWVGLQLPGGDTEYLARGNITDFDSLPKGVANDNLVTMATRFDTTNHKFRGLLGVTGRVGPDVNENDMNYSIVSSHGGRPQIYLGRANKDTKGYNGTYQPVGFKVENGKIVGLELRGGEPTVLQEARTVDVVRTRLEHGGTDYRNFQRLFRERVVDLRGHPGIKGVRIRAAMGNLDYLRQRLLRMLDNERGFKDPKYLEQQARIIEADWTSLKNEVGIEDAKFRPGF